MPESVPLRGAFPWLEPRRRKVARFFVFLTKTTGKYACVPVIMFSYYKIIKFIGKIVLYVDFTHLNEFFCKKNTFPHTRLIIKFVYLHANSRCIERIDAVFLEIICK